jgi:tripartite-type tricarboxylate transporter receptor subunit TctC
VPYVPGGSTDLLSRLIGDASSDLFGQSVIVENRAGAGGMLGTTFVAKAQPDGHTIVICTVGTCAVNPTLIKNPGYDIYKDFSPIILIGGVMNVFVVNNSVPVRNIKELITLARNQPGKLTFGSGGIGNSPHMTLELLQYRTKVNIIHVPYKGSGPALNELIGGQVQLVTVGMPLALPQIKANRIRGLAVTTTKRSISLSDLPTVADTVPGYEAISWFAIYGPKGLSADIAQRWNGEINRILQLSDIKDRIASLGIEPVGGSADRLRDITRREILKWQNVVKLANIKPED